MSIRWMNYGWSCDRDELNDPTRLLVWLTLADHANDAGVCWPMRSTIAVKSRTSERNVSRILAHFEKAGMLVRKFRYKQSTHYLLRQPDLWGDNLSPQEQDSLSDTPSWGDNSDSSGVTDEASGVTPVADRTITKNQLQEPTTESKDVVGVVELDHARVDIPTGLHRSHTWYPHRDAVTAAVASDRYMTSDDYLDRYITRCRELKKQPSSGEWLTWFLDDDAKSRERVTAARPEDDLYDETGTPKSWKN